MIINKRKFSRRRSAQRERIYEIIRGTSEHPTAVRVYETLRREMPTASLGNVYRNIKILVEAGRIASRDFGDGVEHFDAVTGLHYHFICEQCGGVSDFQLPVKHDVIKLAQRYTKHKITGHTIQFFGTCATCGGKRNPKRK
jgi:Fur family peroxide stress response transcriptional regulator